MNKITFQKTEPFFLHFDVYYKLYNLLFTYVQVWDNKLHSEHYLR